MLDHRLRRWSNIEAALETLLVFIQTAPGYDAVSRGRPDCCIRFTRENQRFFNMVVTESDQDPKV